MIWWIVFGVIAIVYIAWIWWEFQHAIEEPPDWTGDSIFLDSRTNSCESK